MKRYAKKRVRRRQAGSLSVELALILTFVLMPMLAGVVDLGQILMAQAVVTRAAREGALAASRNRNAVQAANQYMQNAGYNLALTSVTATGQGTTGSPVTVTVQYDTSQMVIIPWESISANLGQVVGSATQRQS